jgi:urate oxidase/hydroxyisourate hydrolase
MNNPVEFGIDITNHFLQNYTHISRVHVEVHEAVWRRIRKSDGSEHTHGFVDKSTYRNKCSVINDRVNVLVEAGIVGFEILKTRGSAFEDYWTDEFTTLQPAKDRIMSTKANIKWTYDSFFDLKTVDHNAVFANVLRTFSELFANHDESISVQHSIDVIGNHILNSIQEIKTIDFNLPNVHYLLFNLKQFNMENNNEVFTPTIEPYGNIFAKLSKTDHSIRRLNEASTEVAYEVLKDIVQSYKVCQVLVNKRPFQDLEDLSRKIEQELSTLDTAEFLNIISKHARLGDSIKKSQLTYIEEELCKLNLGAFDEISNLNKMYEEKFKHNFILSVTGKGAEEILDAIKTRIKNEPVAELQSCIEEIKKIIKIRVHTVLNSFAASTKCINSNVKQVKMSIDQCEETSINQIVSSHVLDLNTGKPSEGIRAELFLHQADLNQWVSIGHGTTNRDGRISNLLSDTVLQKGLHKIVFSTEEYFEKRGLETFYPEIEIKFKIRDASQKHHIPLLLNQYGFSTYRGS